MELQTSVTEKYDLRQVSITLKTVLSLGFYLFNQYKCGSDFPHTWMKSSFSNEKWGSLSNFCVKTRCKIFAVLPAGHAFNL